MPLPDSIIEVLAVFRPFFTAPTWRKLMTLLTGTLLATAWTLAHVLPVAATQLKENSFLDEQGNITCNTGTCMAQYRCLSITSQETSHVRDGRIRVSFS